ncbi:MAG: hypothetical protein Q4E57_08675 [Eubacteriales bacterium]|nr:hypothetical protein [Eubacteriales bacterium]
MSAKGTHVVKKCAFIMLILAVIAGAVFYFAYGRQKIHCVTGINNLDHYYILEFEKMNREDSCLIPACKDDVFAVNFRIDKGQVDLIIAMDGNTPIYKGNDIEIGEFNVIVSEDGAYRITVNAKHASGYVEVNTKKGMLENHDD